MQQLTEFECWIEDYNDRSAIMAWCLGDAISEFVLRQKKFYWNEAPPQNTVTIKVRNTETNETFEVVATAQVMISTSFPRPITN